MWARTYWPGVSGVAGSYWTDHYWPQFGTSTGSATSPALLQVGGSVLQDQFVTFTLSFPFGLSKRTE